ncbi:hypothetical protein [Burkholderia multivorans]|uniref:hypothetical protein n=1 Tax=Burkholderia multivorans TaxID=87883 RepID=UPI0013E05220|nr:hypothetical protein [Burkholderia multivorans]MBU9617465.1 hypothetical protein [Burkholderia multivorans]NGM78665.1 hypothetical protein [Burkholderia multivorans]
MKKKLFAGVSSVIFLVLSALYLWTVIDHARAGDSTPLVLGIVFAVPMVFLSAYSNVSRLYKLEGKFVGGGKSKEFSNARAKQRFIGELASAIAIVGSTFSLVSALRAADMHNEDAHFSAWLASYKDVGEILGSNYCDGNSYLRNELCPKFKKDMGELGDIQVGRTGSRDMPTLVGEISLYANVLQSRLSKADGEKLSNAVSRLSGMVPNESRYRVLTIAICYIVWMAAVVAASKKLSVAAYDADLFRRKKEDGNGDVLPNGTLDVTDSVNTISSAF